MKTYTRHNCHAQHRTEKTFLRCAIPRLEWVYGRGQYALIAWCKVPTIFLYETTGEAVEAQRLIDGGGCGGRCSRRHEIVRIEVTK